MKRIINLLTRENGVNLAEDLKEDVYDFKNYVYERLTGKYLEIVDYIDIRVYTTDKWDKDTITLTYSYSQEGYWGDNYSWKIIQGDYETIKEEKGETQYMVYYDTTIKIKSFPFIFKESETKTKYTVILPKKQKEKLEEDYRNKVGMEERLKPDYTSPSDEKFSRMLNDIRKLLDEMANKKYKTIYFIYDSKDEDNGVGGGGDEDIYEKIVVKDNEKTIAILKYFRNNSWSQGYGTNKIYIYLNLFGNIYRLYYKDYFSSEWQDYGAMRNWYLYKESWESGHTLNRNQDNILRKALSKYFN